MSTMKMSKITTHRTKIVTQKPKGGKTEEIQSRYFKIITQIFEYYLFQKIDFTRSITVAQFKQKHDQFQKALTSYRDLPIEDIYPDFKKRFQGYI